MKNNGWSYQKIGDLVKVRRGASPRPIDDYLASDGMPWVKISDATADSGRYIQKTEQYIKEDGIQKSVIVYPEDLIISNSATPGLPKILNIKACIHDGWLKIDEYKNVTRDFLYYSIKQNVKSLIIKGSGSIFTNLKTEILRDFQIPVPKKISEQNKITDVLKTIEDKIELNLKINTELESMCKMIYDYWFIQFDFPDRNGKPYKSSGGEMIWDKRLKRKVPKVFEFARLDEVVEINYSTLSNDSKDQIYAYLDTSNLTRNELSELSFIDSSKQKLPSRAKRIINENDILYSTVRPDQEHFGIVKHPVKNMLASTGFLQIKSKIEWISNDFIYQFLSQQYIKDHLNKIANISVSSYPSFSPNDLLSLYIPMNKELVRDFSKILANVYTTISNNQIENKELSNLRDWLLPILMNGQVKVEN